MINLINLPIAWLAVAVDTVMILWLGIVDWRDKTYFTGKKIPISYAFEVLACLSFIPFLLKDTLIGVGYIIIGLAFYFAGYKYLNRIYAGMDQQVFLITLITTFPIALIVLICYLFYTILQAQFAKGKVFPAMSIYAIVWSIILTLILI